MLAALVLSLTGVAGPIAGAPDPGRAAVSADGLTVVRIDGPLDVGTQALLERALDGAREREDELVVELDTPGGEVELMWQLANALLDASDDGVTTVAWVNDRALSAGALLALACERVYMRSHGTIGSALPVQVGPGGLMPAGGDDAVREKLSSALRAEFRGVAAKRGRSELLAEAMVDPEIEVLEVRLEGGLVLVSAQELDDLRDRAEPHEFVRTVVSRGELLNATGSEAVALGLADGLAESFDELAAKLGMAGVVPTVVVRSRSEDLAGWLYALSPLLLVCGFVLVYLEIKTPGFGLPGVLAMVAFGVVLFGRHLVGLADVPHVLLITAGAALVALELFVMPGTLWPGIAGAAAIVLGLIWSFAGARIGLEYELDRVILVEESFRVVSAGFVALLVVWGLSRVLPHTPVLSRMVLAGGPANAAGPGDPAPAGAMPDARGERRRLARVGAPGRATTALRPVGKVVLDADAALDFEARAEGPGIAAGERVRVVEVQPSGRLVVTLLEPEAERA